MADRLRLVMVGAGGMAAVHLAALDRVGRTVLLGVAATSAASAERLAQPRGARASTDVARLLDEERPDVAFVAVPPGAAVAVCETLAERGIPFLTEKPLAAEDADGPVRVARAIAERGLVVAVGYHLRSMEALPEAAERLRRNPPHVVTARWLDATPDVAWWKQRAQGGGQVVEQATHLFDLARVLAGEAEVLGAASVRRGGPDGDGDSADVADATVALLRFASGGLGTFAASRRLASASVGMELAADGELTRIARDPGGAAGFAITFEDGGDARTLPAGRDPFERQAERFLAAVVAGDPAGVPCSYADALLTDRLTRSVVAATGQPG